MIVAPAISGVTVASNLACPDFARESRLKGIQRSGTLRVAVSDDLPGYGWINDDGLRSGLDIRVAQLLSQGIFGGDLTDAYHHIEFVNCAAKDREQVLVDGVVDVVVAAYAVTAERRRIVDFAGVYYGSHLGFVGRNTDSAPIRDSNIGVVDSTVAEIFARSAGIGQSITTFEDANQILDAVESGIIDHWIDARSCLTSIVDPRPTLCLGEQVGPFSSWAVGVAKGDGELSDFVDLRIEEVVDSGALMLLS